MVCFEDGASREVRFVRFFVWLLLCWLLLLCLTALVAGDRHEQLRSDAASHDGSRTSKQETEAGSRASKQSKNSKQSKGSKQRGTIEMQSLSRQNSARTLHTGGKREPSEAATTTTTLEPASEGDARSEMNSSNGAAEHEHDASEVKAASPQDGDGQLAGSLSGDSEPQLTYTSANATESATEDQEEAEPEPTDL